MKSLWEENEEILEFHENISDVLVALDELVEAHRDDVGLLCNKLQSVKPGSQIQQSAVVCTLTEQLQEQLARAVERGKPLSPSEYEALSNACDEIRLRLVVTALGSGGAPIPDDDLVVQKLYLLTEDTKESLGPVMHGTGAITYSSFGQSTVIILPPIRTDESLPKLMDGLLQIYDGSVGKKNWIIDFSAVEHMPIRLAALLVGYRYELKKWDKDLFVGWLKPQLLDDAMRERLEASLDLISVGGYLFSKGKAE